MLFSSDHEWVTVDGDIATIGITSFAADQLGDVVYVELPEVGRLATKGGETAVVESVKAASDVYTPISGVIVEVNTALEDDPSLVNSDSESSGWFFKIKIEDPSELETLMDINDYNEMIGV